MKKTLLMLSLLIIKSLLAETLPEPPELIPYRKGDKWGFCDKNKKIVIECKYDVASPFSEGLALVILNYKYGFIDKSGKEVIPLQYDAAGDFSEGLTCVKLNGKYGYIDKNGTEYWED